MAYKFQKDLAILSGAMSPSNDDAFDLGVDAAQWKDLYIDGVAYIDTLGADADPTTAYIGGGEIDGTVIGGETPAAGSFTAVVGSTGTYSGILKTDDATDATSTTDGSLQTDGGLSVVKDCVFGDDVSLLSDAAVINFGVNKDITLTHVHDTALLLAGGNNQLQFRDSTEFVASDANGHMIMEGATGVTLSINNAAVGEYTSAGFGVTGTGTFSGVLKTDDATEATSTTDGSLQTDGGLSVVKDAIMGNDVKLLSDSAVLAFGAGADVTFTHSNDVGILLNSDNQLQFGDTGTHIAQSADGTLKLTSDGDIEMAVGAAGVKITGTQPKITIGDAGAEDAALLFDGNAQDYRMGLDDGTDKLEFGLGLTFGTTTAMTIDANQVIEAYVGIVPDADDGAYLGTSALGWSDLFLAEGGVINWDNGDMTMTQASDVLTIAGGTLTATFTNALTKAANSGLAMTSYNGAAAVSDLAVDLNALSAAAVSVANDSIAIIDANDSNGSRKESIVDLAAAMAGSGITATNGVFSADSAATPNNVGDANGRLTEGFNYNTGSFTAARTWITPAAPSAGDRVHVKAPSNAHTYTLTVSGGEGSTLDGESKVYMVSPSGSITLTYLGSDSWAIS